MSGNHSHGALTGSAASQNKRAMTLALLLTSSFMVAEVVGGLMTGSLALLADAAHMLTDAGGLAFALLAIRLGERPATPERSYGLLRAEILTALGNAVILLLLTVYILYEAYERFKNPPEVLGAPMLVVAALGLGVNLVSMRLLAGGSSDSLNVRGAYFEVLSDMLGSLGVIVAAVIVTFTGWRLADPIVGAGIGLFIVPRTWNLLKEATHVLLEATPARIDLRLLDERLRSIPAVVGTHHLHVWTITSGLDAMSGHLVISDLSDSGRVLAEARQVAAVEFEIAHVTIQIEEEGSSEREAALPV
ncbi:cation diffusion facilitator family transporter [Enterovirga aerilata]|uniref:Cation transporter n=1 Tax=Enterovirga aerilata TaxID=2730920 RepID=A0A849I347_9HYPH|nr:cation diffusion facilitator family transporter [Enterovirga sp. DB1703]NNM74226.1 cation transporter [Enterovirga sp. DB1703]